MIWSLSWNCCTGTLEKWILAQLLVCTKCSSIKFVTVSEIYNSQLQVFHLRQFRTVAYRAGSAVKVYDHDTSWNLKTKVSKTLPGCNTNGCPVTLESWISIWATSFCQLLSPVGEFIFWPRHMIFCLIYTFQVMGKWIMYACKHYFCMTCAVCKCSKTFKAQCHTLPETPVRIFGGLEWHGFDVVCRIKIELFLCLLIMYICFSRACFISISLNTDASNSSNGSPLVRCESGWSPRSCEIRWFDMLISCKNQKLVSCFKNEISHLLPGIRHHYNPGF